MTSSHHKERDEAIRALVAKLNEMYPDPMTPERKNGEDSSTGMRERFPGLLIASGAKYYKEPGWISAYQLAGWPPEETINLLSLILE